MAAHCLMFAIRALTSRTIAYRFELENKRGKEMDRLSEKLAKAGGVAQRQTVKIEARADALIAREDTIEKRTDAVFSPHESILATAEKGLDGLEDKLRLLSNDPLQPSTGSPEVGQTEPATFQGS